jgi:hypothetical protein
MAGQGGGVMRVVDLSLPFDPAAIHWRVQGKPYERNGKHSAMALAYLDARDVMDRLDEVCGPQGWQSYFDETAKGRVICRLSIKIGDEWVTKSDGAGDTDVEGEKGGISDALKRAAVSWGIGRYLYRLDSPWVACDVNDRGAWKRWAEDPWSKVKSAPVAPKPYDPVAVADRLIAAVSKRKTKQALAELWQSEKDARMELRAASDAEYKRFHSTFELAGKTAVDDPAGQAP